MIIEGYHLESSSKKRVDDECIHDARRSVSSLTSPGLRLDTKAVPRSSPPIRPDCTALEPAFVSNSNNLEIGWQYRGCAREFIWECRVMHEQAGMLVV